MQGQSSFRCSLWLTLEQQDKSSKKCCPPSSCFSCPTRKARRFRTPLRVGMWQVGQALVHQMKARHPSHKTSPRPFVASNVTSFECDLNATTTIPQSLSSCSQESQICSRAAPALPSLLSPWPHRARPRGLEHHRRRCKVTMKRQLAKMQNNRLKIGTYKTCQCP